MADDGEEVVLVVLEVSGLTSLLVVVAEGRHEVCAVNEAIEQVFKELL